MSVPPHLIAAAMILMTVTASSVSAEDIRASPGQSLPLTTGPGEALPASVAAEQAANNPNPVTSDNQIWYRIQPLSHSPGLDSSSNPKKAVDITENLVHFDHNDTGGYIYNSFSITVTKSNHNDPANNGGAGATQAFASYRGDISAVNFGYKPISFPGVVDTQFEFGLDLNTKNTTYAPGGQLLVVGPNFVFDLPGSVNLGVHLAKQWDHNGFLGKADSFSPTAELELSYAEPLDFTGLPLRLEGSIDYTFPEGRGSGGRTTHVIFAYNSLVLDAGLMLNYRAHVIDAFVGAQFYKIGYPSHPTGSSQQAAPYFGVAVHF